MQMRWAVQVLFVIRLGAAIRFAQQGDIILDTSSDAQEEADAGKGPKTKLHGQTFTCSKKNQCISGAHADACVDKYSGDCKLYKDTPKDFEECQRIFGGGHHMKKIEPCMEDIVAAAGRKPGGVFPTPFNQQVRQIVARYCNVPNVGTEGICGSVPAYHARWVADYCVDVCSSLVEERGIKYSGSEEGLEWAQQQEDEGYPDLKGFQAKLREYMAFEEKQELNDMLAAGKELLEQLASARWRAFWGMDKKKCMETCKGTPDGGTRSWSDEAWTFSVAGLPLAESI